MDKPYVKVNYANSIESDVLIFNNTKKSISAFAYSRLCNS